MTCLFKEKQGLISRVFEVFTKIFEIILFPPQDLQMGKWNVINTAGRIGVCISSHILSELTAAGFADERDFSALHHPCGCRTFLFNLTRAPRNLSTYFYLKGDCPFFGKFLYHRTYHGFQPHPIFEKNFDLKNNFSFIAIVIRAYSSFSLFSSN